MERRKEHKKELGKKCWICRKNDANSREHKTKASRLSSNTKRLFDLQDYRADTGEHLHPMGKRILGKNAKFLKHNYTICENCNGARTQQHDFAYDDLMSFIDSFNFKSFKDKSIIETNKIFIDKNRKYYNSPKLAMTYAHLYCVKLFGCWIEDRDPDIKDLVFDTKSLGDAIMNNTPHPKIFIKFIYIQLSEEQEIHMKNRAGVMNKWHQFNSSNTLLPEFISYYVYDKNIIVKIMYVNDVMKMKSTFLEIPCIEFESEDLYNAWHPDMGENFNIVRQFWIS